MSTVWSRSRRQAYLGLAMLGLLLLGSGFAWLFVVGAGTAVASEANCRGGWNENCASVEVDVVGEKLAFFVPNATGLEASRDRATPTASTDAAEATRPKADVQVLLSAPGMTCQAESGIGCVDVTEEWLDGVASVALDPGLVQCYEDRPGLDDPQGSDRADRDDECDRDPPVAAFFLIGVPVAVAAVIPDGGEPEVVRSFPEDEGSEGGTQGGDEGGTTEGGDEGGTEGGGEGGTEGGDEGGTEGGDEGGTEGGDEGGTEGGDEGGTTEGGDEGGTEGGDEGGTGDDGWEDPTWDEGDEPPMTEVPEPISTTLFGLGLASYAGARLRKRRNGEPEEAEE